MCNRDTDFGGIRLFDWADQTFATWLAIPIGIVGALTAYFAVPRRKLDILFGHARLLNDPLSAAAHLEIVVTSRGQVIDQPVYLVHVQVTCAGNRDIAMQPEGEFIEIEMGDGIELLGSTFGPPGKLKLDPVENTNKSTKFKFDLLKRSQTLYLNYYVKSSRDLTRVSLPKQFPTTVHVRDVRAVFLAKHRWESIGSMIMGLGIFGAAGGLYLFAQFAPIDQARLLMDDTQQRVWLQSIGDSNKVKVCEAVPAVWQQSQCRELTLSEVATFKPAPKISDAFFVNPLPIWQRVLQGAIFLFFLSILFWGEKLGDRLIRLGEKLLRKEG